MKKVKLTYLQTSQCVRRLLFQFMKKMKILAGLFFINVPPLVKIDLK